MPPRVSALLLAATAALVAPSAASAACASADAQVRPGNTTVVERAAVCLINVERRQHGLRRLRVNRRLRVAARSYSRRMVAQRFFEHVAPSGSTLERRLAQARYARRSGGWFAGENLAYGQYRISGRRIVRLWMKSPAHRANVLQRGFREIGLGVAVGTPTGGPGAAGGTFTANFGARH